MELASLGQERRDQRDAHAAAHIPHHAVDRGGVDQLVAPDRRQGEGRERDEDEADRDSLDEARERERPVVHPERERRHHVEADRVQETPESQHHPLIDPRDDAGGEERQDVADAARSQHQAGRPRVVVQELLGEDGDQQHAREHAEADDRDQRRAHGEVAVGEDGQVQDGLIGHQLSNQEAGQRADRDDRHREDRRRVEPLLTLPSIQDELETPEAHDHQPQAPRVDPPALLLKRRVEQAGGGQEEADDADRQVDVEDPAPRPLVGQIAADGRPQDRAEDEADSPHRHRHPSLMEGEDLPENGLRERDDRPAAEALEDPRGDQRGQVGRGPGDERADREQGATDQEEPLAPEHADEPSRGRDDHGIGGEVRGDHPRDLVEPRRQRSLKMRQHDVGHARVQDLHEGHHHDREGDGPLPAGGDRRRIGCGGRHAGEAGVSAPPGIQGNTSRGSQVTMIGVIASSG